MTQAAEPAPVIGSTPLAGDKQTKLCFSISNKRAHPQRQIQADNNNKEQGPPSSNNSLYPVPASEPYSIPLSSQSTGGVGHVVVSSVPPSYQHIPVDDFGAAMLRGMGWKQEKDIDTTDAQTDTHREGHKRRRQERQGLGADKELPAPTHAVRGPVSASPSPTPSPPVPLPPVPLPLSTWCRVGIRVRVVSRSLLSGRAYLCKGAVVDVVDKDHITVQLDGTNEVIHRCREQQLETVIPKQLQSQVVLLEGTLAGRQGTLVQIDKKKETALVEITHDTQQQTVSLTFEQLSEAASVDNGRDNNR